MSFVLHFVVDIKIYSFKSAFFVSNAPVNQLDYD